MDYLPLLIDLHKQGLRQGPGGDDQSQLVIELACLDRSKPLKVADIGCGTGAGSLYLAKTLNAQIIAVDVIKDFLDELSHRARQAGVEEKISTLTCGMDELSFADDELDIIWSEGSIYNIGFEKGISQWQRFLKSGGLLVVSEMTWTTEFRPTELQDYWTAQYPEIDTASAKIKVLENHGYSPLGHFILPESCWLKEYYEPMEDRFEDFLLRNEHTQEAMIIVDAERKEIEMYRQFKEYYGYGVYIGKKR
jgi:ubiquinone/menaquinone biosynthesis C-methylase UbiE